MSVFVQLKGLNNLFTKSGNKIILNNNLYSNCLIFGICGPDDATMLDPQFVNGSQWIWAQGTFYNGQLVNYTAGNGIDFNNNIISVNDNVLTTIDNNTANIINLTSRVSTLENSHTVANIVCEANAASIPEGAVYNDGTQTITGTLIASVDTTEGTYFVRTRINNNDVYLQYITVRSASTPYTYSWQYVGSNETNLSGYAKTITVNRKTYSVANSTTDIALDDVVTNIVGETKLSTSTTSYIAVTATPSTALAGVKNIALESEIHTQDVSTSQSGKNGIALAFDVKQYVAEKGSTIIREWTEEDIPS